MEWGNTIIDIGKAKQNMANNLKTSDPDPMIEPLIGHLKKESRTLKEIFNEFCWLEMQE